MEQIVDTAKNLITLAQAWHYRIVPYKEENTLLYLYIDEARTSSQLTAELEMLLNRPVQLSRRDSADITHLLNRTYPKKESTNLDQVLFSQLTTSDTNFLPSLVREARDLRSSDIHIEAFADQGRIRFRVDGALIDRHQIKKTEYPILVNKIKIAASCDIAEKRLPQDGRIQLVLNDGKVDIRVSILPTLHGEKVVLRLLGADASHIKIETLGFTSAEWARYERAIKKPHGIILISGPTGSGKTTTLYATLKMLNTPARNILTIEDPIEYTLSGVNQVQLKENIGLDYNSTLRTFLRQDPDIIMLGEIRDPETAKMAVRASLTGHLVLSTIHTNSAWGTISRLIDMGIPPYLLSTTLTLSVAQRLIRMLCPECKEQQELKPSELPDKYKSIKQDSHFKPVGCAGCHYTGFKGRKAIYEVLDITRELSNLIKNNATDITSYLISNKISPLETNAFSLYANGETSIEEVYAYLL